MDSNQNLCRIFDSPIAADSFMWPQFNLRPRTAIIIFTCSASIFSYVISCFHRHRIMLQILPILVLKLKTHCLEIVTLIMPNVNFFQIEAPVFIFNQIAGEIWRESATCPSHFRDHLLYIVLFITCFVIGQICGNL